MLEARREIKPRLYIVNTIFFRISEQKEWKELRRRTLPLLRLPGFHRTSRSTLSASSRPPPLLAATALQINTKIKKLPPLARGGVRNEWWFIENVCREFYAKWGWTNSELSGKRKIFSEANTKKVRRAKKFFSGNRFKKIYHTKIYSPSAPPWQACEEYRIMGIHSTEPKRWNEA